MAKPGNVLTNVSDGEALDDIRLLLKELLTKTNELFCEQQITNLHLASLSDEDFSKEELD
jgi:hypothetical protein